MYIRTTEDDQDKTGRDALLVFYVSFKPRPTFVTFRGAPSQSHETCIVFSTSIPRPLPGVHFHHAQRETRGLILDVVKSGICRTSGPLRYILASLDLDCRSSGKPRIFNLILTSWTHLLTSLDLSLCNSLTIS